MTRFDQCSAVRTGLSIAAVLFASGCLIGEDAIDEVEQQATGFPNATGFSNTWVTGGPGATTAKVDKSNPFFASLGINDRTCESCHQQAEGWTITPAGAQKRFDATAGTDPLFRLVDGASSPRADVSTVAARRAAYSMVLTKGLIRVGIGIPANAEFRLIAVDDPYGFASAAELSLFRRPLPTTNVPFLATLMWDGRETTDPHELDVDLTRQSGNATTGHAEATSVNAAHMSSIVAFENRLFTTQVEDNVAGKLDKDGALGGPNHLANQEFYIGINDPLGGNPTGAPFDPNAFTLFDAWKPPATPKTTAKARRQYAIFRGQQLFNTKPIAIAGVKGINDALGVPVLMGTCTTCHDSPNVGNHSVPLPIDIGLSTEARRTPDLPLYTLKHNGDGRIIKTTDPGRALITGKWNDINKFKGPVLRGLSARPPYFHNGSAATLREAVLFYDERFQIGFSAQEIDDVVAFLSSL